MRPGVLLDTGPLVAYLWARDRYHAWAVNALDQIEPPLITCEPVLTEACFLSVRNRLPAAGVLQPVERGRIQVGFDLGVEVSSVRALMERYADVPMSLADACLVRMAEISGLPICT